MLWLDIVKTWRKNIIHCWGQVSPNQDQRVKTTKCRLGSIDGSAESGQRGEMNMGLATYRPNQGREVGLAEPRGPNQPPWAEPRSVGRADKCQNQPCGPSR